MQTSKTKQQHTSYLWDGNRQLQQNTATHTHTIIYEQDSFEPVAQLIWLRDGLTAANDEPESYQENQEGWYGNNKPVIKTGVQLYHYHNDHLGTPNELTDQQGEVVWFADYEAWGNTATVEWREQVIDNVKVSQDELQPIRFQGQSFDTETGLHYNRFRYFDPDLGMFTTRDPIGLLGGSNVFAYAPNPTGWIDPFGLAKTPTRTLQKNWLGHVGNKHTNSDVHHGFPEEFSSKFERIADIDVNNPEYYYNLPKEKHTKKPGIHTNSSRTGKNWNKTWKGILEQVESMNLSKIESKKILQNALRGLARKERISKHNASAVRNSQKCVGK